jgi:phage-related protein
MLDDRTANLGSTNRTGSGASRAPQESLTSLASDVQEKAVEMTRQATKQASDMVKNASDTLGSTVEDAKNKASAAVEQTKASATSTAHEAVGKVREFADSGKNMGADVMEDIAHAVEGAAGEIEGQAPGMAKMARNVAKSVEGASHDLRDSSIDQIGEGIVEFARKQPIGAMAGAFLAGIVISRLMSSSR